MERPEGVAGEEAVDAVGDPLRDRGAEGGAGEQSAIGVAGEEADLHEDGGHVGPAHHVEADLEHPAVDRPRPGDHAVLHGLSEVAGELDAVLPVEVVVGLGAACRGSARVVVDRDEDVRSPAVGDVAARLQVGDGGVVAACGVARAEVDPVVVPVPGGPGDPASHRAVVRAAHRDVVSARDEGGAGLQSEPEVDVGLPESRVHGSRVAAAVSGIYEDALGEGRSGSGQDERGEGREGEDGRDRGTRSGQQSRRRWMTTMRCCHATDVTSERLVCHSFLALLSQARAPVRAPV